MEDTLHESHHCQETIRDEVSWFILHIPWTFTWKSSKDPRLESDASPSYFWVRSGLSFFANSTEPRWWSTTWVSSKMGDSSSPNNLVWEFTSLRLPLSWKISECIFDPRGKNQAKPILFGEMVTQSEATRSSHSDALVSMMSFIKPGIWCSWNGPTDLADGGVDTTICVLLRRLRWGVSEGEETTSSMDPWEYWV